MQEMRRALRCVLEDVDLQPVGVGSERVARSSIAFVPDRRALAVVTGTPPRSAAAARR
jgi:hypothetical protein